MGSAARRETGMKCRSCGLSGTPLGRKTACRPAARSVPVETKGPVLRAFRRGTPTGNIIGRRSCGISWRYWRTGKILCVSPRPAARPKSPKDQGPPGLRAVRFARSVTVFWLWCDRHVNHTLLRSNGAPPSFSSTMWSAIMPRSIRPQPGTWHRPPASRRTGSRRAIQAGDE